MSPAPQNRSGAARAGTNRTGRPVDGVVHHTQMAPISVNGVLRIPGAERGRGFRRSHGDSDHMLWWTIIGKTALAVTTGRGGDSTTSNSLHPRVGRPVQPLAAFCHPESDPTLRSTGRLRHTRFKYPGPPNTWGTSEPVPNPGRRIHAQPETPTQSTAPPRRPDQITRQQKAPATKSVGVP